MAVILAFPAPVVAKQIKSPDKPLCDVDAPTLIERMVSLAQEVDGEFISFDGPQAKAYIKTLDDLQVKPHLDGDNLLIVQSNQGVAAVASYDKKVGKFCGKVIILPPPIHLRALEATQLTKNGKHLTLPSPDRHGDSRDGA